MHLLGFISVKWTGRPICAPSHCLIGFTNFALTTTLPSAIICKQWRYSQCPDVVHHSWLCPYLDHCCWHTYCGQCPYLVHRQSTVTLTRPLLLTYVLWIVSVCRSSTVHCHPTSSTSCWHTYGGQCPYLVYRQSTVTPPRPLIADIRIVKSTVTLPRPLIADIRTVDNVSISSIDNSLWPYLDH